MVKGNKQKEKSGPPHLQARVSYLYQAASYLSGLSGGGQPAKQEGRKLPSARVTEHRDSKATLSSATPDHDMTNDGSGTASSNETAEIRSAEPPTSIDEASIRLMLSHIKGIGKKGQVKVSPSMKHSICKRCGILLIDGRNSSRLLENQSRAGKKPWADVLVITCKACGTAKRFPVGAQRQARRKDRAKQPEGQANEPP